MSTTKFTVAGKDYYFNFSSFKNAFNNYHKAEDLSIGEAEQQIADELYVTSSAVHNWRYKKNGIADLETVKKLANIFNIDYMILLEESKEVTMKEKYTDLQIQSVKRIYDEIIDFLYYFSETDGFNDLWHKYKNQGAPEKSIEATIYAFADAEIRKIDARLQKEFFYLHDLSIYDELYDYVWEDLMSTYDGKCSYAYRFEAVVEDVNGNRGLSTSEEYLKALNKLNDIVKDVV
jgi:transcriptional regulator with XRE-family HTH domain